MSISRCVSFGFLENEIYNIYSIECDISTMVSPAVGDSVLQGNTLMVRRPPQFNAEYKLLLQKKLIIFNTIEMYYVTIGRFINI